MKGQVQVSQQHQFVEHFGDVTWTRYWLLHCCPACSEPTLSSTWWSDELSDPEDESKIIYPSPRDNSALPPAVRQAYEAALRVKKIDPGLYAVGIRRMLEAVCNDQGVTKGDL
jgi:hypothetical protein